MNVELHIDRLVLVGLPVSQHQGELVMAAVRHELGQLLTSEALHGRWASSVAVPAVQGASIFGAERASPARLGERIAGSVMSGMGGRT